MFENIEDGYGMSNTDVPDTYFSCCFSDTISKFQLSDKKLGPIMQNILEAKAIDDLKLKITYYI